MSYSVWLGSWNVRLRTSAIVDGVPTGAGVEAPIAPPVIGSVDHWPVASPAAAAAGPHIQNWRCAVSSVIAACGALSAANRSFAVDCGTITLTAVSVGSAGSSDRRSSTEYGRDVGAE